MAEHITCCLANYWTGAGPRPWQITTKQGVIASLAPVPAANNYVSGPPVAVLLAAAVCQHQQHMLCQHKAGFQHYQHIFN